MIIARMNRPRDTLLFLISDLEDTGSEALTEKLFQHMVREGVQCYNLVSLNDMGRPQFNRSLAEKLKRIGVPYMYCTPTEFPSLLESVLEKSNQY